MRFRANQGQEWLQSWPLNEGNYVAVLSRGDDDGPWPGLAVSAEFQVGNCPTGNNNDSNSNPAPPPPASDGMVNVIANARRDIERLIAQTPLLLGKFLRLIFHDCVGGCDGCIDMSNPDNAGLQIPISFLRPIEQEYADQGLSRTDIWMLSAVVASDVSEISVGLEFPFQWIGRQTCEEINNGNCGRNFEGNSSPCSPTGGPNRILCHADTSGTRTIEEFMFVEFGMNAQQTTAIMGAHTVGAMRAVNLGFEGIAGWDLTNAELDHGYFAELDGPAAADWVQVRRSNNNFNGIPPRWQFQATVNGVELTMLNSDIAMVRNLEEGVNLMPDGRVTCNFSGNNACDDNTPFTPFVQEYARSRALFLPDYRDALEMMIENGYERDRVCRQGEVCVLTSLL